MALSTDKHLSKERCWIIISKLIKYLHMSQSYGDRYFFIKSEIRLRELFPATDRITNILIGNKS